MLLQTFRASHEHYSEKSNYTALMHCCLVNLLAKLVVCCPLVPDATNPNKNIKVGMSKMGRGDSSEVQKEIREDNGDRNDESSFYTCIKFSKNKY